MTQLEATAGRSVQQPSVRPRRLILVAGVALMALAGCGSTDDGGGGGGAATGGASLPAEAASRVEKALQPITAFPGPKDPIAPAAGKKVTVITCSATGEQCVRVATGAQQAGKVLGWDVNVIDGKGQPAEWNAAVSAALAGGTDGIILSAVPPALVSAGMAAAKKAGVPVIFALGLDAQGATALVAPDRAEHGRVMADYLAKDSGGTGQVMLLRDAEFPDLEAMDASFKAELKTACPKCTIKSEQKFTLGAMSQTVPTLVQTAVQSNPGINYVFAPYDAASSFVNQGLRAGGHPSVKVFGTGADGSSVKSLESGDIDATMGVPAEWIGFQSMDALARSFAGKPIPDTPVVQGLVVKSNLSQVASSGTYDGGFDYAASYKKLWGK